MSDFLDFARYLFAIGVLFAACAGGWRNVSRHYDRQQEK